MSTDNTLSKTGIVRVDSHQHFWQLSLGFYSWLTPKLEVLYKDFLPEQLIADLSTNDVSQTILVQAAEDEEEIYFMLGIAEVNKFVAGVVGWVDMEASNVLEKLAHFCESKYFKGIRPMLQDIDDVNWLLKDEFTPIFEFMIKKQLTFDALIKDIHISNINILAQRHPDLGIVINHCAKPDLSKAPTDFWKNSLNNVATCKNIYIKLSGLLTEAPQGQVNVDLIQPYFDHIMTVFGSDRIMWGSDWPVMKLNGDYDTWVSLTQSLLKNYSFEDKGKIWAGNTQKFYRLSTY
jgi:L-fuconolactonase